VSPWHKVLAIAYPVGDVVLGVLARLLTRETARDSVVRLLVVGASGALASDVVPAGPMSTGRWAGRAFDLGWAICYATWRGRNVIELRAAATSAALFVLVLSRLWDVDISHERGQDRERALRMAGAAYRNSQYPSPRLLRRPEIPGRRDPADATPLRQQPPAR
jgi:hypothetical protein